MVKKLLLNIFPNLYFIGVKLPNNNNNFIGYNLNMKKLMVVVHNIGHNSFYLNTHFSGAQFDKWNT